MWLPTQFLLSSFWQAESMYVPFMNRVPLHNPEVFSLVYLCFMVWLTRVIPILVSTVSLDLPLKHPLVLFHSFFHRLHDRNSIKSRIDNFSTYGERNGCFRDAVVWDGERKKSWERSLYCVTFVFPLWIWYFVRHSLGSEGSEV